MVSGCPGVVVELTDLHRYSEKYRARGETGLQVYKNALSIWLNDTAALAAARFPVLMPYFTLLL